VHEVVGDLSKHFSAAEFACPHCGRTRVSGRLITALEDLRALANLPIRVTSGYRCPEHNAAVGGKPDSGHLHGDAADIVVEGHTVPQMVALAALVPEFAYGGIGAYDAGFIHVDVRPGKARWARVDGRYVGIDALIGQQINL
jgi:uncharacterized protein YcbK (DUF882 family)